MSDDGLTSSVFQRLPANHVQVVVLVTSGHCYPSVADEEWYFPKRPSSTVATQHCSEAQYRGESPIYFRLYVSFPLNGISSTLTPLCPSGTGWHAASVVPFVGPDSSLSPLRWTFTALRCRDLTGSSLAKSFTVFYGMLNCQSLHDCGCDITEMFNHFQGYNKPGLQKKRRRNEGNLKASELSTLKTQVYGCLHIFYTLYPSVVREIGLYIGTYTFTTVTAQFSNTLHTSTGHLHFVVSQKNILNCVHSLSMQAL